MVAPPTLFLPLADDCYRVCEPALVVRPAAFGLLTMRATPPLFA